MDLTMFLRFPGILILIGVVLLILAIIIGLFTYKNADESEYISLDSSKGPEIELEEAVMEIDQYNESKITNPTETISFATGFEDYDVPVANEGTLEPYLEEDLEVTYYNPDGDALDKEDYVEEEANPMEDISEEKTVEEIDLDATAEAYSFEEETPEITSQVEDFEAEEFSPIVDEIEIEEAAPVSEEIEDLTSEPEAKKKPAPKKKTTSSQSKSKTKKEPEEVEAVKAEIKSPKKKSTKKTTTTAKKKTTMTKTNKSAK